MSFKLTSFSFLAFVPFGRGVFSSRLDSPLFWVIGLIRVVSSGSQITIKRYRPSSFQSFDVSSTLMVGSILGLVLLRANYMAKPLKMSFSQLLHDMCNLISFVDALISNVVFTPLIQQCPSLLPRGAVNYL